MRKWSVSAHNCFRKCQRQYFFRHIMPHHNAKDEKRREAHLLRQFCSLDEWRGKLVHLALEKYFVPSLQEGNLISLDELMEQTWDLAEAQVQFSREKKYKQPDITKTKAGDLFLALKIDEYNINTGQEKFIQIADDIEKSYKFLYANSWLLNLLTNGDWYEAEPNLPFKFNQVTITAKLDLVMGYGDRKICVIDWKIGHSQTSDYSRQLYLYALAVIRNKRWSGYKLQDLLLIEANLLQNKFIKHAINISQELEIEDFLYRSISEIQAVTSDHKYNLDNLEDYEYANSPLSCEYCNFEQLCRSIA